MKRPVIIVVIILLAVAVAFAVWPRSKRGWQRPEVTVRFLGMTNDAAGVRQAIFELRNTNTTAVGVFLPKPEDGGVGDIYTGKSTTLKPAAALVVYWDAPTILRDRWYATFFCYTPLNMMQKIKLFTLNRRWPYDSSDGTTYISCYSEWMGPTYKSGTLDWLPDSLSDSKQP